MDKELMIHAEGLGKVYRLYDKKSHRLLEAVSPLQKSYHREFHALKNINLDIYRGDAVGILGVNGSGKSTLLKVLTGVVTPTTGTYTVNGKISALLELGTGFNSEYTGMENIYLNGTMMGYSKEEMEKRVPEIVEFADIGDFINQPVKNYSSGMFARLAFAVAISIDPEILIVDEALSVGDVFFQTKCYKKFDDFRKQGKTILFVSHDLSSMVKYCNRALLLNEGEKIAEGTPKDIIDLYKKLLSNQLVSEAEKKEKLPEAAVQQGKTWKSLLLTNQNPVEYGSKSAEIIDYAIIGSDGTIGNAVVKFENFSIKVKVRFHAALENPIIAVTIKNRQGIEITGTNTMIEGKNFGPVNPGDVVTVTFTQRMTIQGGELLLSLGCTGFEGDDLTIYHRLYDVCPIQIVSSHDTVGYFDLESDCTVEKNY